MEYYGADMIFYFKQRKYLVWFCFTSILLVSINVRAIECGVLQLQANRSSGVSIKTNKCKEISSIAIGAVLYLSAKGRLWLKSTSELATVPEFQMICQNRTKHLVQLEFSDMLSPWLNQSKLGVCSGWVNNKLSCAAQNNEKAVVQCVLSFFKSYSGYKLQQMERTTSVKMRDIKNLIKPKSAFVPIDKKSIIEAIKPELKLCKKLNGIKQQSKMAWVVDQNDDHIEIDIISAAGINYYGLFECVQTVISTFPYPTFSEKVDLSIEF